MNLNELELFVEEEESVNPFSEDEGGIDGLLNANITCYTNGLQVESIISSLNTDYYLIPKFQRKFVWNKTQVSYLALSIIKSIPIPPLYLYVDRKKQVLLDGQQRATAIFLYFNDLFYASSDPRYRKKINFGAVSELNNRINELKISQSEIADQLLNETLSRQKRKELKDQLNLSKKQTKELEKKLKNEYGLVKSSFSIKDETGDEKEISFSKFDKDSQNFLLRKRMDITIVECRNERPQRTYANIFKLLNSGGKLLGAQEIRNGIYWETKLYEDLYTFNESNAVWRKIYGKLSMYSKDMEILLKILSLNFYSVVVNNEIKINYNGTFSWSNIMEGYSNLCMDFSEEEVKQEIGFLEKFFSKIQIDEESKKCKKVAVVEAVFVASCKLNLLCESWHIEFDWIRSLEGTDEFINVLSSKGNVENRLTKAYRLVKEKYNV